MPGMIIFNRRWAIATDDFLGIGVVDTLFFSAWLCWTSVIFANYLEAECNCLSTSWCSLLDAFLSGACGLFLLNTLLAISFIIFSTRGTISEPGPRRYVVNLVQFKLILSTLDFCWAVIGSLLYAQDFECGDYSASYNCKVLTICFWVMFVARVFMVWMFYDPRGKLVKSNRLRKTIPNEYLNPPVPYGSFRKWRHRLQAFFLWFTAPSEDRRLAIGTVSELLAFICHDVDLVASDLIAGLVLYKQKCMKQCEKDEENMQFQPKISLQDGTVIESLPSSDMPDWMNLKLAEHYLKIGMGIFGWPWTIYRNLACGVCALFKKCLFCFPCRRQSSNVRGDNCCGCNVAGLQITSEVEYQDLVHVSFVNRVYEIPFYVALDHAASSVVLTARGSMSCADALTDMAAAFEPIDDCGLPKASLCHGGVLLAARRIKEKLDEGKILEKAFAGHEDYRLVVTGHSLGAGVASLLTLMYRSTYNNVICFAFAPPPVINEAVIPETLDCIFAVLYGNDIVPYLNYWNVREMVVEAVQLLKECKLPKHKVLFGCQKQTATQNGIANPAIDADVEASNDIQRSNEELKPSETNGTSSPTLSNSNGCTPTLPEGRTRFFMPGRILHVRHSKKYGYRLRMCDQKEFQPLMGKRKMVAHHLPQYLQISLSSLLEPEVPNGPTQITNGSDSVTVTTTVDIEPIPQNLINEKLESNNIDKSQEHEPNNIAKPQEHEPNNIAKPQEHEPNNIAKSQEHDSKDIAKPQEHESHNIIETQVLESNNVTETQNHVSNNVAEAQHIDSTSNIIDTRQDAEIATQVIDVNQTSENSASIDTPASNESAS